MENSFHSPFPSLTYKRQREIHYLFNSDDEAAYAWRMAYNNNSIVDKVEYGSVIYEVLVKKKRYFRYSIPNKAVGRGNRIPPSQAPKGKRVVADIHSHGNAWGLNSGEYKSDNDFSTTDKWGNYENKINGYLLLPTELF